MFKNHLLPLLLICILSFSFGCGSSYIGIKIPKMEQKVKVFLPDIFFHHPDILNEEPIRQTISAQLTKEFTDRLLVTGGFEIITPISIQGSTGAESEANNASKEDTAKTNGNTTTGTSSGTTETKTELSDYDIFSDNSEESTGSAFVPYTKDDYAMTMDLNANTSMNNSSTNQGKKEEGAFAETDSFIEFSPGQYLKVANEQKCVEVLGIVLSMSVYHDLANSVSIYGYSLDLMVLPTNDQLEQSKQISFGKLGIEWKVKHSAPNADKKSETILLNNQEILSSLMPHLREAAQSLADGYTFFTKQRMEAGSLLPKNP